MTSALPPNAITLYPYVFFADPSVNLIGMLNCTLTASPLCFPGFQRGIRLATRTVSSSQPPPIPRKTLTLYKYIFFSFTNLLPEKH